MTTVAWKTDSIQIGNAVHSLDAFAYPNGVGVTGRYVTESGGSQLACMERCVR